MLVAGFHSGHDCSYCVLENGKPLIHVELERYLRKKEPFGDGLDLLFKDFSRYNEIKHFSHSLCSWKGGIQRRHPDTYKKMFEIINKNDGGFFAPGHHEAHAANAFYSSNLDKAIIVSIDGGGREYFNDDIVTSSTVIYLGEGTKITPKLFYPDEVINIGAFWASMTQQVFGLSVGYPNGNQCGTVMAMAALGKEDKYIDEFLKSNLAPWNFDFNKYKIIANQSEQDKFNIAFSLQNATEIIIFNLLYKFSKICNIKNLCLTGGVFLNSVLVGKILEHFNFENIYVCPVPYDSGLSIGCAQYVWHHVLGNERINWNDNFTSFLGKQYTEDNIMQSLISFSNDKIKKVNDDYVIDLLDKQNIISIYGGRSESGRRALGNRSILADPRDIKMKSKINEKVKHRQWFRPFAPSILRENVSDWFIEDIDSPYMSFVVKFKDDKKDLVPAVVHYDGTARLQTVSKENNEWYYNFIKKWHKKTGIPMILNTSFNDREPIVETPSDAVNCFNKTEIDYLYFYDIGILISR